MQPMKKLFLAALLLPFYSCVIVKFPDTVQIDVAAKDLEFLHGKPHYIEFGSRKIPMEIHIQKAAENDTLTLRK
jgi:hypothetical protein